MSSPYRANNLVPPKAPKGPSLFARGWGAVKEHKVIFLFLAMIVPGVVYPRYTLVKHYDSRILRAEAFVREMYPLSREQHTVCDRESCHCFAEVDRQRGFHLYCDTDRCVITTNAHNLRNAWSCP